MSTEEIVTKKVKSVFQDERKLQNVSNPALKDAFESVLAINKSDELVGAYTKHSAHTKTSTKGCVMGCIGG